MNNAMEIHAKPCGSWLACDGGGSASPFVIDTPLSQASQLPQWIFVDLKAVVAGIRKENAQ